MIMRKYLQYILAICLLFCACDDREIVESGAADDNAVTMSFYAGIESYPDSLQTRTVLGGIVSDNTRKVLWLPDDDIYVTNGTIGAKFTNIKTETASIAEFEGSISPGDNYFAVFPYSMVTGYSSSQFQINLPSVQQYVKDGIAAESFPMVAQCADNQFNFRNVCGILVLNLIGEDVIDSIRFSGTDSENKTIKVSGTGTIRSDYGESPVLSMTSAAKDVVTLNCTDNKGKGVKLDKTTPTVFHIVLPAGKYQTFVLEVFSNNSSTIINKKDNPLIIRRSERTTTSSIDYVLLSLEYVDLGLSVNWATCNIGATKPEEYGDYFAWGATEPHYEVGYAQEDPQNHWKRGMSTGYKWSTYKYCNGSSSTMTKYCTDSSYGAVDNKTVLDLNDDAAHVNWGGSWRMPTIAEFRELRDNCTWTWTTMNGIRGYKVVSKKSGYAGNWIFLPAAGRRGGTNLYGVGSYGDYWSASLYESSSDEALVLFFYSDDHNTDHNNRYYGRSVRPVCPVSATGISLDKQSVEIMEGGTETLTATVNYEKGFTGNTATWSSSNNGVATVDDTGKITAVSAGTCTITATVEGFSATCTVTVKPAGHEFVDLGLSVKWATCNIGAESPEEYGDYFAWGETEPHYEVGYAQEDPQNHWKSDKSDGYNWSTYKYCKGSNFSLNKYCKNPTYGYYNYRDTKSTLDPEDDAAHVNWGGIWRMPTDAEFYELRYSSNCTWTWTTMNGINGYKVVSKKSGYTGNWIFLPAAGRRRDTSLDLAGSYGYYWSSSLDGGDSFYARYLYFDSDDFDGDYCGRSIGHSVRPVFR